MGKIKNLLLSLLPMLLAFAANSQVNYGNNPAAGHYQKMADGTNIYYEIYGSGQPLLLLHGGLFGEIGEYSHLIPQLSAHFQVIAMDTRGHAKSNIGHQPYTYDLMADDAYSILYHVTQDSAVVIGFSDGAIIAADLGIKHPKVMKKLIFMGGNPFPPTFRPGVIEDEKATTGPSMLKQYPDFVKSRKALMPEPERWDEFVDLLKQAWLQPVYLDGAKLVRIKCPVIVIGGDHDDYSTVATFGELVKKFPDSRLAIIPGSNHLVMINRPDLTDLIIASFLGIRN